MNQSTQNIADDFLTQSINCFRSQKELAERAMSQLDDGDFFFHLDDETNSIYVVVKHLAGNYRSRWTDFLTADGEKPDRNRDNEFEEDGKICRDKIMAMWEAGWQVLFDALEGLNEDDLLKTVYIRREAHTVIQAILRAMTHCAYHVGQIVTLAKHIKKDDWQCLSIPKGKSQEYNRKHGM